MGDVQALLKELSLNPDQIGKLELFDKSELKATRDAKKWVISATGAGGFGGLVGSIVSSSELHDHSVAVACIIATGFIVGAGLLALARIIDGDVRTRGSACTEAVRARAEIGAHWLDQPKSADDNGAVSVPPTVQEVRAAVSTLLAVGLGGIATTD